MKGKRRVVDQFVIAAACMNEMNENKEQINKINPEPFQPLQAPQVIVHVLQEVVFTNQRHNQRHELYPNFTF